MLRLRSSVTSPFGRKVKVVAHLLGLSDRIEVIATDTMDPSDPLRTDNPLGKIPCLILEDGTSLYDSRVIAEYFDHLAGDGKVIPKDWNARLAALKLQALADGITDAAILQLYEGRFRKPEMHEPAWIAHQGGKVERGLVTLEAAPPKVSAQPDIGVIATACTLEWYRFRFPGKLDAYPALNAFLAAFNTAIPAFKETAPR